LSARTVPASSSAGRSALLALLLVLGSLPSAWLACDDDDGLFVCENGTCYCRPGRDCEIPCAAPPCHVECVADNRSCTGECGNGSCLCGDDSNCALFCHSPPCHVRCEPGALCSGTCANGTCACERSASCDFTCESGPCHVQCAGDNLACDGECANGSCTCGPNSVCRFRCLDGNCAASCAQGARCTLACDPGRAGERGCRFDRCAAGEPVVCPGADVVTCGAPCEPAAGSDAAP
jgi:hypothetical protein